MEAIEWIEWMFSSWPRAAAVVAFVAGIAVQGIWRRFSVQGISAWIKKHDLIGRAVDNLAFPLLASLIILVAGTAFNRTKAYFATKGTEQQQADSKPGQDAPAREGANAVVNETKGRPSSGSAHAGEMKPPEQSIVVRGQDAIGRKSGEPVCSVTGHSRLPVSDFVSLGGSFYRCEHCQAILKFVADADGVKAEWPEAGELAPIPPPSQKAQHIRQVQRK